MKSSLQRYWPVIASVACAGGFVLAWSFGANIPPDRGAGQARFAGPIFVPGPAVDHNASVVIALHAW